MINLILARDKNHGIGYKGKLPWPTSDFREDMSVFKKITTDNIVVMGTKTWDSLPPSVKPLPNRTNIVLGSTNEASKNLSSNPIFMQEIYQITHYADQETCWVIGGARTYAQFMPFTRYILETVIDEEYDADVHVEPVPHYFVPVMTFEYQTAKGVKVKHTLHKNGIQPGISAFEKEVKKKITEALAGVEFVLSERDTFYRA